MLDSEFTRVFDFAREQMQELLNSIQPMVETLMRDSYLRERENRLQLNAVDSATDKEFPGSVLKDIHWNAEVGLHGIRYCCQLRLEQKIREERSDLEYDEYHDLMDRAEELDKICREFRDRLDELFEPYCT